MTAKVRAAIYVAAAAIGAAFLIQGWANSDQVEAWLKVLDSLLNIVTIVAPLMALKFLTPDTKPTVPGELVTEVDDTEGMGG